MVHTLIEEEIFYPACRGHVEELLLEEAQVEHDGAKALIMEIKTGSLGDQYFDAKVKVLSEAIKHHMREEEKPDVGIFAKAKEAGLATTDLAKRLAARKQELMEQAEAGTLGPPETRSFRVRTNAGMDQLSQEKKMARGSSSTMERERDERGRFVSDDDDRDYRRRSMPPSDEEGRFVSSRSRYDDDEDPRYSRSWARYDDDDDYRRGRRGHDGWFGDPEGHSEASRRGWDDPDHCRSGWCGDPEGHSEASRRGWEEHGGSSSRYRDDDRCRSMPARDDEGRFTSSRSLYDDDDDYRRGGPGHGGWYGDPERHSAASHRGWGERVPRARHRDDDDDGRYSRSCDDYDDDDRRGSRRHGGWYGDPEGHPEAARRRRKITSEQYEARSRGCRPRRPEAK